MISDADNICCQVQLGYIWLGNPIVITEISEIPNKPLKFWILGKCFNVSYNIKTNSGTIEYIEIKRGPDPNFNYTKAREIQEKYSIKRMPEIITNYERKKLHIINSAIIINAL